MTFKKFYLILTFNILLIQFFFSLRSLNSLSSSQNWTTDEGPTLFVALDKGILLLNNLDPNNRTLVAAGKGVQAVQFFMAAPGLLVYSQIGNGNAGSSILTTNLNELDPPRVLINADLGVGVSALAVDWVAKNLYWINRERGHLEVAELFTGSRRKLLLYDLDRPVALAVDPLCGRLFWASELGGMGNSEVVNGRSEDFAYIGAANMDGSGRLKIRIDGPNFTDMRLHQPTGLTLDLDKQRIFWSDTFGSYIASCGYDGSQARLILRLPSLWGVPISLAIYKDRLYWSSRLKQGIDSCRTDGLDLRPISRDLGVGSLALVVLDQSRQPARSNPCHESSCSDLCLLRQGYPAFSCACRTGVRSGPDGCASDVDEILLVATTSRISGERMFKISLDTYDYVPQSLQFSISDVAEPIQQLDYDPVEDRVYWSLDIARSGEVWSARLDGSDQRIEMPRHLLGTPEGLAVDWLARQLYVADAQSARLWVVALANRGGINGAQQQASRVLVADRLHKLRALVVDPVNGWLFWSDWGHLARIERARLDGSDRIDLVRHPQVMWPNGLALDIQAQLIYYADARLNEIKVMDYEGHGKRTLVKKKDHMFGLSLLGVRLYWTDWGNNEVRYINTDGMEEGMLQSRVPVMLGKQGLNGIRAVKRDALSARNQAIKNPCSSANNFGNCTDFCFYMPQLTHKPHRVCGCGKMHDLAADGVSCAQKPRSLLIADHSSIRRFMLPVDGGTPDLSQHSSALPLRLGGQVIALTADVANQTVFWATKDTRQVWSARMDGLQQRLLLSRGLTRPRALSWDWVARQLYILDSGGTGLDGADSGQAIDVVALLPSGETGARRRLIDKDLYHPTALAVDPQRARFCWTDDGRTQGYGYVECANMDGSGRRRLVTRLHTPCGLRVVPLSGRLIWLEYCNGELQRPVIGSVASDGNDLRRLSLSNDEQEITSIDIFNNTLFWIEWGSQLRMKILPEWLINGQLQIKENETPSNQSSIKSSNAWRVSQHKPELTDLTVMHSERQPSFPKHPCVLRPCRGLLQLCFAHSSSSLGLTRSCGCPSQFRSISMSHVENNKKGVCVPPENYLLLLATDGSVHRLAVDESGKTSTLVQLNVDLVRYISHAVYDPLSHKLIFSAARELYISESLNNGASGNARSDLELTYSKLRFALHSEDSLTDMAYEPNQQLLFLSCRTNTGGFINVTLFEPENIKRPLRNLGTVVRTSAGRHPMAIVVDPDSGFIYWAESPMTETGGESARIMAARLDGNDAEILLESSQELRRPEWLRLDVQTQQLYWLDKGFSASPRLCYMSLQRRSPSQPLEVRKLAGMQIDVTKVDVDWRMVSPSGLAVLGNRVFWIQQGRRVISAGKFIPQTIERFDAQLLQTSSEQPLQPSGSVSSAVTWTVVLSVIPFRASVMKTLCMYRRSDCSHLCLPDRGGVSRCACPFAESLHLDSDGRTCLPLQNCVAPHHFKCRSSNTCLPAKWRCDGKAECHDSSDEENCDTDVKPTFQTKIFTSDDIEETYMPIEQPRVPLDPGRTTYTVAIVIAVLAIISTFGIAGYSCTRRKRPLLMRTDMVDIMLLQPPTATADSISVSVGVASSGPMMQQDAAGMGMLMSRNNNAGSLARGGTNFPATSTTAGTATAIWAATNSAAASGAAVKKSRSRSHHRKSHATRASQQLHHRPLPMLPPLLLSSLSTSQHDVVTLHDELHQLTAVERLLVPTATLFATNGFASCASFLETLNPPPSPVTSDGDDHCGTGGAASVMMYGHSTAASSSSNFSLSGVSQRRTCHQNMAVGTTASSMPSAARRHHSHHHHRHHHRRFRNLSVMICATTAAAANNNDLEPSSTRRDQQRCLAHVAPPPTPTRMSVTLEEQEPPPAALPIGTAIADWKQQLRL